MMEPIFFFFSIRSNFLGKKSAFLGNFHEAVSQLGSFGLKLHLTLGAFGGSLCLVTLPEHSGSPDDRVGVADVVSDAHDVGQLTDVDDVDGVTDDDDQLEWSEYL